MGLAKKLFDYALPIGIAATAFLNAQTVNALIGAHLATAPEPGPVPERSRGMILTAGPDARPILERNPFEHGAARVAAPSRPAWEGQLCDGIRPLVIVGADDHTVAFAALDAFGKRVLRREGDEVAGRRVAFVGRESVWLSMDDAVCEARLFAPAAAPPPPPAKTDAPSSSPLAGKVERMSASELRVDRAAISRLLDTPSELAQMRVVPDGKGVKLGPVRPGSTLALLGLEGGDRLEAIDGVTLDDTERMMAAYARLRTGNLDRLRLRVTRQGRPLELDYEVR